MTANPLKTAAAGKPRVIPPQGDSPAQRFERERFWIEYGNAHLAEIGKRHLHWVCRGGSYSIEPWVS